MAGFLGVTLQEAAVLRHHPPRIGRLRDTLSRSMAHFMDSARVSVHDNPRVIQDTSAGSPLRSTAGLIAGLSQ